MVLIQLTFAECMFDVKSKKCTNSDQNEKQKKHT